MPDFSKSKGIGKFGENLVLNYFRLGNIEASPNADTETRSYYDLLCSIGRKKFTVEVKLDFLCAKTGNLAIETWNCKSNQSSGISITKADLWCVLVKDSEHWAVFITRTSDLKEYINSHKGKTYNAGGDGNANLLLYKMEDIIHIFKRIDNLGKMIDGKIDYTNITKTVKGLLK